MMLLIVKGFLFAALLITATIWDIRKRMIPDTIVLAILFVGGIGLTSLESLFSALLDAIITAVPYLLASIMVRKKEGLSVGGGDVKLMAASGFVLGIWGGILQSVLALTLAVVVGMITAAIKHKKINEIQIPLAPYLGVGGIFAYCTALAVKF